MALKDWSTTAASNTGIISGMSLDGSVMTVSQADNAFRDMAAQLAAQVGKVGADSSDIASASTTNLANATGWFVNITGTTTITGFGTVDAGQLFILRFPGSLTLTHSASLFLPGAANITTLANDVAIMKSGGSGNWRCIGYLRHDSDGTYTPTITDGTNVTSSSAASAHYARVGNQVTVHGTVIVAATSSGATDIGISLPVASNFTATTELVGQIVSQNAQGTMSANGSDRADANWAVAASGPQTYAFSFMYTVV